MEQAIARLLKIHNVCIAEFFSRMGIIEQWENRHSENDSGMQGIWCSGAGAC